MGSGKTSLLALLESKFTGLDYYYVSMEQFAPTAILQRFGITSELEKSSCLRENTSRPKLLMLDDCQSFYDKAHKSFWELIVKSLKLPPNIHVVFVATRSVSIPQESPICMSSLPSLSRQDLMLTTDEATEMLTLPEPVGLSHDLRHPHFMDLVAKECGGLIAAIRISINTINGKFRSAHDKTEERLVQYLFSADMLNNFDRCFIAQPGMVSKEVTDLLVELLTKKSGIHTETCTALVRSGVLVVKNGTVQYSSPLAARFMTRLLFPTRHPSTDNPTSLSSFVKSCIENMSATALLQSVADDTDKPKEAVYQHLFMQAMHACSPPSVVVCPELSRVFPSGDDCGADVGAVIPGELDFYLNGGLRWGIELLVGGRGIGEHMSRFAAGGKYAKLNVSDYAVVDFRKSAVTEVQRYPKRITVFFDTGDFRRCTVYEGTESIYMAYLKA